MFPSDCERAMRTSFSMMSFGFRLLYVLTLFFSYQPPGNFEAFWQEKKNADKSGKSRPRSSRKSRGQPVHPKKVKTSQSASNISEGKAEETSPSVDSSSKETWYKMQWKTSLQKDKRTSIWRCSCFSPVWYALPNKKWEHRCYQLKWKSQNRRTGFFCERVFFSSEVQFSKSKTRTCAC